jgi:GTPase SAR1 family protein
MQRLNAHLHTKKRPPYVVNLDPAVLSVPFDCNIDIRDSVDYKEVMKQYNLGPNGGIMTALNLFTTKVDQILTLLEKRAKPDPKTEPTVKPIETILVDTPGQIEVFVWSASGSILLDSFASSFPTVIAYVIDTPRTNSTSTFMANMLYACSILYKTKLPMVLVFNKIDVQDAEFAKEWMTDFETFQAALQEEQEAGSFGGVEGNGASNMGSGYMGSLMNSMSLMLEEFYRHLKVVGVSAMTGQGVDEFFVAVQEKVKEFNDNYKPELERRRKERDDQKSKTRDKELGKLMNDVQLSGATREGSKAKNKPKPRTKRKPDTISDIETDSEDDDIEAELVEPDSDEGARDDDDQGSEDGLTKRYQSALKDSKEGRRNEQDESFARYIKKANVG